MTTNTAEKINSTSNAADDRKELEKRAYDLLYRRREENSNPTFRWTFLADSEHAFETLLLAKCTAGKLVLEIGCGDGTQSIKAAQNGARVFATDISEQALDLAREKARAAGCEELITFAVQDAENLQLPDNFFDVILNHEVFSSINLDKALPEFHRVLNVDGCLIGQECLGHNVLFNLNRQIKTLTGRRTKWAVSHILRLEDFVKARIYFAIVAPQYFHFLVLLGAPLALLPNGKLKLTVVRLLAALDRKIFQLPFFSKLAFKTVFEFSRPLHKREEKAFS